MSHGSPPPNTSGSDLATGGGQINWWSETHLSLLLIIRFYILSIVLGATVFYYVHWVVAESACINFRLDLYIWFIRTLPIECKVYSGYKFNRTPVTSAGSSWRVCMDSLAVSTYTASLHSYFGRHGDQILVSACHTMLQRWCWSHFPTLPSNLSCLVYVVFNSTCLYSVLILFLKIFLWTTMIHWICSSSRERHEKCTGWGMFCSGRLARVGSVILVVHDASDIFLEIGKLTKYSGLVVAPSIAFVLFAISWVILRLIIFPFVLIRSTRY